MNKKARIKARINIGLIVVVHFQFSLWLWGNTAANRPLARPRSVEKVSDRFNHSYTARCERTGVSGRSGNGNRRLS